jgi:hypothetical protein
MNLIDTYIFDHYEHMSVTELSERIGIECRAVSIRKYSILQKQKKKRLQVEPLTISQEIVGLIKLIEDRQTGWAVDVAKQRLNDLKKITNKI